MSKEQLVKELIDDGYLKTPAIIEAFQKIDRLDFVPAAYRDEAYGNYPLMIGYGQTISQPLTVAFMLELLEPKAGEKILDIGSGSGWQTALLAQIVGGSVSAEVSAGKVPASAEATASKGRVIAIERIPELKIMGEQNVSKYNFIEKGIVEIIGGDGSKGYESEAPFDKIIAAAAAQEIPESWKKQVKVGGRIVTPVGNSIYVLDKTGPNEFSQKQYFGFSFVPLITDA